MGVRAPAMAPSPAATTSISSSTFDPISDREKLMGVLEGIQLNEPVDVGSALENFLKSLEANKERFYAKE